MFKADIFPAENYPYIYPLRNLTQTVSNKHQKRKTVLKRKATTQIAHLVFATAKFQRLKNQKSNFLPTLSRKS